MDAMDDGLLSLIDSDTSKLNTRQVRQKATSSRWRSWDMLDFPTGRRLEASIYIASRVKQGLPQYIQIAFTSRPVIPKRLILTFQGGFVGTHCSVQVLPAGGSSDWQILTHVYPEDVNKRQSFDFTPSEAHLDGVTGLKLVFEKSSDFFGRVTVYDLKLEGSLL